MKTEYFNHSLAGRNCRSGI